MKHLPFDRFLKQRPPQKTGNPYISLVRYDLDPFPEKLLEYKGVERISLSHCKLGPIPDKFFEVWPNLKAITIERCKLEKVPKAIGKASNLTNLNLSDNRLKVLPEELTQLSELYALNLENNKIEELPKGFGQLTKLHRLFLNRNPLKRLPDGFRKLKNIRSINIRKNKFETFPMDLLYLPSIGTQSYYLDLDRFSKYIPQLLLLSQVVLRHEKEETGAIEQYYEWLLNLESDTPYSMPIHLCINALQTNNLPLQKMAWETINTQTKKFTENALDKDNQIFFIGKPKNLSIRKVSQQLKSIGARRVLKFSKKVTHIVLGMKYTDWAEDRDYSNLSILEEVPFNKALEEKIGGFLLDERNTEEGQQNIDNIRQLLLSETPDSIGLAVELMNSGGFPKELLTECLIAFKMLSTKHKKPREGLRKILYKHVSERAKMRIRLQHTFYSKYVDEPKLRRNWKRYTGGIPEFSGDKIALHFYKRYKIGHLYLFTEGSTAAQKLVLKDYINNKVLDLSNLYYLKDLPSAVQEFPELEKIILKKCGFNVFPRTLTKCIEALPNLKSIDLSFNPGLQQKLQPPAKYKDKFKNCTVIV